MAFATVQDLESRWRELTEDEAERAEVLLDDAAVYLSALVVVDAEDEQQQEALKIVSCNIVRRMMNVSDDLYGVSDATMTADIYSQRYTFAGGGGNMYITKPEKRMLGIGGTLTNIRPVIWGVHEFSAGVRHDSW